MAKIPSLPTSVPPIKSYYRFFSPLPMLTTPLVLMGFLNKIKNTLICGELLFNSCA